MKQELLRAEVELLLLKYGADAVLRALAFVQDTSVEELRASIRRLRETRPSRRKQQCATAVQAVDNMHLASSEKAELLRRLAKQFDNRSFLAELRDVRAFLDRFHVATRSIKSRQDSVRKLFERLADLSVSELRRIDADNSADGESAFSALADEIMGTGKKMPSRSNLSQ